MNLLFLVCGEGRMKVTGDWLVKATFEDFSYIFKDINPIRC